MSTYYVIGEESQVFGTSDTTFEPYDCMPEYHNSLEGAQEEYDDWFGVVGGPTNVGIWKIEKVES